MNAEELRALQAPFKNRYRQEPDAARQTLVAEGTLDMPRVACQVHAAAGPVIAGLHPSVGGDGSFACAGDMLLQALVGCAGVTLAAVATALQIPVRGGQLRAEGIMDFRGTLGVGKDIDVGFQEIRLSIVLDSDASQEQLDNLLRLTRRYCVVYQTLAKSPRISESITGRTAAG
jgi:uncharacterized OsmC-like protein